MPSPDQQLTQSSRPKFQPQRDIPVVEPRDRSASMSMVKAKKSPSKGGVTSSATGLALLGNKQQGRRHPFNCLFPVCLAVDQFRRQSPFMPNFDGNGRHFAIEIGSGWVEWNMAESRNRTVVVAWKCRSCNLLSMERMPFFLRLFQRSCGCVCLFRCVTMSYRPSGYLDDLR